MNDFSSIDRLVEFGMGMAVAQQMINTMNYSMQNMAVAGSGINMPQTIMEYYVVVDGQQAGPYKEEQLEILVRDGKVTGDTLVWRRGLSAWKLAQDVPDVNKLFLLVK